ncbi:MAG: hypothetical protein GX556_01315 [Fibrobacter sp.]|nr:hypothetical protein [Fibrobacter sp.]
MSGSKKSILIICSALFSLFTICQRVESPLLSNYDGDYSFTTQWTPPRDTFHVLTPYALSYYTTGRDTFAAFRIETSPDGPFETSFLNSTANDSQFTVIFTEPFNGSIILTGIRPNLRQDACTLAVIVKNQFRLSCDTEAIVGSSVRISVPSASKESLTVDWYSGDNPVVQKENSHTLDFTSDTAGHFSIYAVIKDSLGNSISTDTADIFFSPASPLVSFPQKTLQVPSGQQYTLAVQKSNCDSLSWVVKKLNLSTATTGPLSVTFTQQGPDTVIVRGSNRFGMTSDPDTLFVSVSRFTYDLQAVAGQFPDTIRAGKWAKWEVSAFRDSILLDSPDVSYFWSVKPDSIWDSIRTSTGKNSLELFIADSQSPFTINVSASVGNDTTYSLQKFITIREFRPTCTFITENEASRINRDLQLSIRVSDSNDSGSIAEIFYKTSDTDLPQSTGGQKKWTVRFLTPGRKVIQAWAVDNDGFTSDTALIYADIEPDGPFFIRPLIDTSVYINDTLRIPVPALVGDGSVPVEEYLWDFDNDGNWDKTTALEIFDTVYNSEGLNHIRVQCISENGDTALNPAELILRVSSGTPHIQKISFSPVIIYVRNSVAVSVRAADSNGVIKQIAIGINDEPDSIFSVKEGSFVDTVFKLNMTEPGRYRFKAAAIDEDGQKSGYVSSDDSLTVSSGDPIMVSVKPDTCWIYDDTTFTIKAFDVNGTISDYFIQWESGLFNQSPDSIISHSFSSEGLKRLRVYVADDDGYISDTLTDSVYVLLGKPSIRHQFPDSVWYRDTVQYQLTGIDSNGTISRYAVSWERGHSFEFKNGNLFSHSYLSGGLKEVKAFVIDDDSLSSDTITISIYVKPGFPSFESIRINRPASEIFIRDSINFTVRGSDPDGFIDSIYLSLDNDTVFERKAKAASDSAVFRNLVYSRADSGSKKPLLRIKDSRGLTKDSTLSITVRSGAPSVDSLDLKEIWVVDTSAFKIHSSDPNGYIVNRWIDWDINGVWDDSLTGSSSGSHFSIDTFYHSWDILSGGKFAVFNVKVMDEDSVMSAVKTCSAFVRLGRPLIEGNASYGLPIQWKADTMFYVYTGTKPTVAVDTTDTNGVIQKFYWDSYGDGIDDSTDTPKLPVTLPPNTTTKFVVRGIDDDMLISKAFTFYAFADAPPPDTFKISYRYDPSTPSSFSIRWQGLDAKDDSLTSVLIISGLNLSELTDTITDGFEPAINFTPDLGYLSRTFNPQSLGYNQEFYFKVVLRDARGSMSEKISMPITYP